MIRHTMREILPSIFTLGNILCGFLAIINVIEGNGTSYITAAWWIIIAAIFDALDGKVARITGSSSKFGVEFDSIADVVSFGAAPAVLIYSFMLAEAGKLGYLLAFCFLAAGAIRLARFNISATTVKKNHFIGMPIPAGACIIASFILFSENVWGGFANFDFTVGFVIFISLAMVSRFKYGVLPKIRFATKMDILKSIWLIIFILFIIRFPDEVFFPAGILYLLSGPVKFISMPAVNHVLQKVHSR